MPRRKTRKTAKIKENTDPDASMMADGADSQILKKETFIRDFDLQGRYMYVDTLKHLKGNTF